MASFADAIMRLNEIGVYDVVLPFILIFVIIFAGLQKTRVLGTETRNGHKYGKKNLNLVIAVCIAGMSVIPHVVSNDGNLTNGKLGGALAGMPNVVEIMNHSLPSVSVWIVGILMLLLILGLFGSKFELMSTPLATWVTGAAVIIIGYIFLASAGYVRQLPRSLQFLSDPSNQAVLIIILVFAIVIWFVVREPPATRPTKFEESLNKWWGVPSNPRAPPPGEV
ncbi:hypothetical protein KY336_03120 [Candidatus Woesearchaeota archaeon]|nr:hypothetical protein [Candidatus Woesearchaeota archaeon]